MALQFYKASNWNLSKQIALEHHQSSYAIGKLDNSSCFLFRYAPQQGNRVTLFDQTGARLDSISFAAKEEGLFISANVYALPDGQIWLKSDRFYLWNPQTNSVTEARAFPRAFSAIPISADTFVKSSGSYNPETDIFRYNFSVVDSSNQVLISDVSIAPNGDSEPINVFPLSENTLLIFYRTNDNAYSFNTFDFSLNPVSQSPLEPFPQNSSYAKDATCTRVVNRLVFAISDIRNDATGRDIFASMWRANDLKVGVEQNTVNIAAPAEFSLSEAQPNPVSVGNKVNFNIQARRECRVEFRLYNVLGQQILPAQSKRIVGSTAFRLATEQLPAGIYFLSAASANYMQIKKLVLAR